MVPIYNYKVFIDVLLHIKIRIVTWGILYAHNTTKPHFEKEKGQKWVPCSIFFSINIFTSIISFLYINVPTFTIFRNLQPLSAIALNVVYPTSAPQLSFAKYIILNSKSFEFFICAILF